MPIHTATEDSTWSTIPCPPPPAEVETVTNGRRAGLMTVGELAHRTGLSHKAIRDLEGRGLIYSAGRSESNYRLFDETALWCVGAVRELRSLGLTLAEIEQLHSAYAEDPSHPPDGKFAAMVDRAEQRTRARIAEQQKMLKRIQAARQQNREALVGTANQSPTTADHQAAA